jgi:F0F1-type ATP synthase alpha subunit
LVFSSSKISTVIEERISNYYSNININVTGKVITIGDGIVRAFGLGTIQTGEMCEFPASIIKNIKKL